MAGGEHRPTVAASLGDPQGIARLEPTQHGQVVEQAAGALREAEPRLAVRDGTTQVAPLHPHQPLIEIVIRDL